ncbi:DUF1311 domain-containing protein [Metabacillus halosaccharovorans]|uniref:DUF1311 domain-containing protein n=1 Tax=Metabacillus halosaccharovorans TaxID=930124 RepID=UPI001C1F2CB7|nr:DUF1311 domain-containing protein [Metabacillus halosaccharovorans]MBU7594481.1 DUF1311 domain-containing protein [Metabacillus halosaccharovorans]
MRFKLWFLLLIIVLLVACSNNEQTKKEVQTNSEQEIVEETTVKLEKNEVQDLLRTNLDNIFEVFVSSGEENGWNTTNAPDFNILRPEFLPFATESFIDTTLKEMSQDYYCECDAPFKPNIEYDVHFTFEETDNSKLHIEALEPATELSNTVLLWSFNLVKEEDSWKMKDWNHQLIEDQDLKLTKEEAEILLTSEYETPEFVEEYESKDTGGKAFLFKMKGAESERLVGISSENSSLLDDYELEKETNQSFENAGETVEVNDLYSEFYEKLHFGMSKEELIAQFGEAQSEKELSSDITLQYTDAIYTISKSSNQVYKVELIGEKASTYYKNFDEIVKAYNPDPVYAEYLDEVSNDENGYHLLLDDGYSKSHLFTSDNEKGNPIKTITIQVLNFQ